MDKFHEYKWIVVEKIVDFLEYMMEPVVSTRWVGWTANAIIVLIFFEFFWTIL